LPPPNLADGPELSGMPVPLSVIGERDSSSLWEGTAPPSLQTRRSATFSDAFKRLALVNSLSPLPLFHFPRAHHGELLLSNRDAARLSHDFHSAELLSRPFKPFWRALGELRRFPRQRKVFHLPGVS